MGVSDSDATTEPTSNSHDHDNGMIGIQSYDLCFKQRYERKGGRLRTGVSTSHKGIQIWQVLDKTTKEICSMKVLKKSSVRQAAFQREIDILKECNGHPNLLHVKDVFECDKFYYIITQNLNQPNVLQFLESLRQDKKHPNAKQSLPTQVAIIIRHLMNGLVFLHDPKNKSAKSKTQIVNGNIHPKNILIPKDQSLDDLILVDWSVAKMTSPTKNLKAALQQLPKRTRTTSGGSKSPYSRSTSRSPGRSRSTPGAKVDLDSDLDSSDDLIETGGGSMEDYSEMDVSSTSTKIQRKGNKTRFHAPEFNHTGPTPQTDLWSVGILTFLLLTGCYPYEKPSDMKKPIQDWKGITDVNCQKFIQALLQYNPTKRPNTRDINKGKNVWFNTKGGGTGSDVLVGTMHQADFGEVMHRLISINREHEFQVAVRSYIATQVLQKNDRDRYDQIFRLADKSNNNSLSRKEFEFALREADIDFLDQDAITSYFDLLDINNDHSISYTEFMAFCEKQEELFERNNLRLAFDAFDYDKSGSISANDILQFSNSAVGASVFQGEKVMSTKSVNSMIQRADKNGNGKISFGEFCDMMLGQDKARLV